MTDILGNVAEITADEFLRELFEHCWCYECGRDHRHHTACVGPFGNWFAKCDREPAFDKDGELIINPENYED